MKFRIAHIFWLTLVFAVLIATGSHLFRPALELSAIKYHVKHELDHDAIRKAAIPLIANGVNKLIKESELPDEIAVTSPKFVHVAYDCVTIEYGTEPNFYGLIIDPTGQHIAKMPSSPPNTEWIEADLGNGVYFFEIHLLN